MRSLKIVGKVAACIMAASLGQIGCSDDADNGSNGTNGNNGLSTLVNVAEEPAGDNCANGGQRIETGLDADGNGTLDGSEIATTSYVCNGGDLNPETTESCTVCHGPDRIRDVEPIHPDPLPKLQVIIGAVAMDATRLKVNFRLEDPAGTGISGVAVGSNRFYLNDIVPAGTIDASGVTWATPQVERWAYERNSSGYPLGIYSDLGSGSYSYTFATQPGSEGDHYNISNTKRVVLRMSATGYSGGVGVQDFTLTAGGVVTKVSPARLIAPADGCFKCHSDQMDNTAHGSSYLEPRVCVMCHSPIAPEETGEEMRHSGAWLANLVHKIHAAIDMPAFSTRIGGLGYGAVTYPQDVRNCETCHTGNEGSNDAWKTNPTIEGCTTCHTTVTFDTSATHTGGTKANGTCDGCHTGADIEGYHTVAPEGVDVPEFDVNLAITAPANGTHYVEGETPLVTVTLNHAGGAAVNSSFYTSAQGAAGDTSDTALRVASVYIYGPRSHTVPVLATGTITDPDYDPTTLPTQGHPMFDDGTDPQVESDAAGFKYRLLAIPADLEPGTYMVRVRIGDYSRVGTGDYVIESTAFTTIQIGTETESLKVAGDACQDCHGTGNFLPHNERHSAVFDTDECSSCHDYSHNHAIPISNRVHAIHSGNSEGDLYTIEGGERDWSEVTYPAKTNRCTQCHNSGDLSYHTNPTMPACAGCHVESTNFVVDHMRQNGGHY